MNPHPPELKAAALAAVASGESVSQTARTFGIGRATVQKWVAAAGLHEPTSDAIQQKKQELGEQVYGLIEDSIAALRAQLRVASDEAWIKRQSAGELAVFHGVINDKTVRLLASLRPDDDGELR